MNDALGITRRWGSGLSDPIGRDWIRKRVFESFEDSPAGAVLQIASLVSPLAPGFEVGADAIADSPLQPNTAEWSRFEEACADVGLYTQSA